MQYNRRQFLNTFGLGTASFMISSCLRAQNFYLIQKPNFILILVDDLGWVDTGCYGSGYYETPHIDRLASQGMKFTNGYAACAVCSPTRASIMTGCYPARIGITDWIRARFQGSEIPVKNKNPNGYESYPNRKLLCPKNPLWMECEEVTIAEMLKAAGYTTCHIGKWHLGTEDWYPDKQGFDVNIGGCDFGQPPSYFDPYFREKQGFIPTLKPRKMGEYLTDREADEAVQFIRENKDSPFFLYLAHYAVHTPIQAKEGLIEKYRSKRSTHQKNPVYAAMVESVDQALGRILDALDTYQLANNTMVIFTSDNGGLLGKTDNTPLRAGKGYPYEGGIREPVIIRWPGVVKAGSICDEPVSSIDYFPTICDAAQITLPTHQYIDGVSLMPLVTEDGSINREAIFWHFPHYRQQDIVPYSIIRADGWKLIKRYEGKPFELFDLNNDLSEKTDLSEKMDEKVKKLNTMLNIWLRDVGAKIPKPNPNYR